MPSRRTVHVAAFFTCLTLWTIALLIPVPKEAASKVLGDEEEITLFGKCLHVGAYVSLTILGGAMPLSRRQRWLVLGLLSFHGFATEFFQQFVERHASIRDVGLDHIGIVLGVLFGWHWWRGLRSSRPDPDRTKEMA
jgi:VanZ family protein